MTANLDKTKTHSLEEAVTLLPEISTSKFKGSVDMDIQLNISEKQKKEGAIRGNVIFPNNFGEPKKVAVIADEKNAKLAKEAGAVAAGDDKLIKDIESDKVEFDVVLATPEMMPQVAKLGKILGPKGLMPNPNSGTVVNDVENSVKNYIAGKQNFKANDQDAIKAKVGQVDMPAEKLKENILSFCKAVHAEVKHLGTNPYKKIMLKPTMGPAIKLDIANLMSQIA